MDVRGITEYLLPVDVWRVDMIDIVLSITIRIFYLLNYTVERIPDYKPFRKPMGLEAEPLFILRSYSVASHGASHIMSNQGQQAANRHYHNFFEDVSQFLHSAPN
jgi:hypothetical protein